MRESLLKPRNDEPLKPLQVNEGFDSEFDSFCNCCTYTVNIIDLYFSKYGYAAPVHLVHSSRKDNLRNLFAVFRDDPIFDWRIHLTLDEVRALHNVTETRYNTNPYFN